MTIILVSFRSIRCSNDVESEREREREREGERERERDEARDERGASDPGELQCLPGTAKISDGVPVDVFRKGSCAALFALNFKIQEY